MVVQPWATGLRQVLAKYMLDTRSQDKEVQALQIAAVECCLAIMSAYYTTQKVIMGKSTDDEKAGVMDMLNSLTTGLPLGNMFFTRQAGMILPLMLLININTQHAYLYLEQERKGGNTESGNEARRKIIEAVGLVYQVPILILALVRGELEADTTGAKLREEVEKILVLPT